ncbi:F-box/LRR-repeat protein At4g14103-like [Trifolium pratense]|uniref:F-box/LRR-repeat protein At4g14103-like n=1 Tax=Trifolium pratense TaxID=57577 RepID=UPI001E690CC4|nr:F-box/LRR-repeat protein At4g14103-like [Trifolium pratense]
MTDAISLSKLSKLQRHNVGNMKDMISELPEGVLLYILSFLPTKDAVRTTILAKTWRYLWTHLSVFDFEVFCHQHGSKPKQKSENRLINQVDNLLQRSNRVERLCIKVRGTIDAQKATSLLSNTLLHKVPDLKLSIEIEYINDMFVLPNSFSASQSLNNLYLEFDFNLNIGDDICFPSLKTLYLSHICFVNEKSAQRLLSGCPVLQELTLFRCSLLNVKQINVAMSALRKLTIEGLGLGYPFHNCTIKFDVGNLLSLSYTINPAINFFLVNPTSIVDASIHLRHLYQQNEQLHIQSVIELLSRLSSVKTLSLSNYILQVCLTHSSSFAFVRQFDAFLCKTPKLEVLHINKGSSLFFDEGWTSNSLPCCLKSSLKLCFISNFHGNEDEIRSVQFLLENATVLEYINIFCSEYLSLNLEELADVRNQLQHLGLGRRCIIKLQ